MAADASPAVDVLLVTALREEHDAVVAALGHVEVHRRDGQDAALASIGALRVAADSLRGMGPTSAAATTTALLGTWRAPYVVLVGISGGVRGAADDLQLGDVLVPEQVVGYEPAKVKPDRVHRRPEVHRPGFALLSAARDVTAPEWVPAIGVPRPVGADRSAPLAHFGTVLSGEKVIADIATVEELRDAWPKSIGIEMEGYGVALAADRAGRTFLMVKGVSDLADVDKDDRARGYAAEAAAHFALAVLRRAPFAPTTGRGGASGVDGDRQYSGRTKIVVCRGLVDEWADVADYFGIQRYERVGFEPDRRPQRVWEWLVARKRLGELPAALRFIGRADLAEALTGDVD
jgi:nucleoside phosphorylase